MQRVLSCCSRKPDVRPIFKRGSLMVWVIVAIILLLNFGCASTGGFPRRPVAVPLVLKTLEAKYYPPATDVLQEYGQETDESKKIAYRNEVVYGRMLAIDMYYSVFKKSIYKQGVGANLSFDILGVIAGTSGAVFTVLLRVEFCQLYPEGFLDQVPLSIRISTMRERSQRCWHRWMPNEKMSGQRFWKGCEIP